MSAENLAVAEQFYVSELFKRVRQPWLSGFAKARKDWDVATPKVKKAVGRVEIALRATFAPGALPERLDPLVIRLQVFNLLRRLLGGDPVEAAGRLLAVDPPRSPETNGWRAGVGFGFFLDPVLDAWGSLLVGVITCPIWDVMDRAWSTLRPETRAVLARSVGDGPPALDSPEAFAWLDWAGDRPAPPELQRNTALRGLTPEEGEALATLAIDQQEAWIAEGLIVPNRRTNNQEIERISGEFLNHVHAYHGRHSPATEIRIQKAGINIYFLEVRPESDDEDDEDEPHFRAGFALIPIGDADPVSPAVRAGHGEPIQVGKFAEPLLVLLDLDLTSAELAFLGLKGTRLRVCDWSTHRSKLCFTRVGLDGEVSLIRKVKGEPGESPPDAPSEPFVLGPSFDELTRGSLAITDGTIGGPPPWEQEPEVPKSPDNRCPMTFIAKFPHPNGGSAFAFIDPLNLIATIRTQWD